MIPPIIILGIACVGFFVAFFLAWRNEYRERNRIQNNYNAIIGPNVFLECSPSTIGSKAQKCGGYDFDDSFRVIVRSIGVNSLINCHARLIEISKDGKTLWSGEEVLLTFVISNDKYEVYKELHNDMPSYLEILGVKDGEVKIASNRHKRGITWNGKDPVQDNGIYTLKVTVMAVNALPIECLLEFIWTGQFATSSMRLTEQRVITPPLSIPDKSASLP